MMSGAMGGDLSPKYQAIGKGALAHCQKWKKAWTRGHCPRKFLRIVEISGL